MNNHEQKKTADYVLQLEIDDNKKLPLSASISRKHVAKFMLDNLETNNF